MFLKLVSWSAFFLKLTLAYLVLLEKYISCIAPLRCLSFIMHIYLETWCSVLCIFYSRSLCVLCGAVSVPCEQTYTFVIYIWIYLGSRTNQHKVWSVLLFYMVWSCRICRWDLPIGTQYTWHDCPLYMWRWCPILGRWVHALEIWSMACHPICVIALSAGG